MLSRTNAAIVHDTAPMRTLTAMVVLAGLGCGIAGAQPVPPAATTAVAVPAVTPVPLPRPRPAMVAPPPWIATLWNEPRSFREAAGADFKTDDVTSEMSPCRARLEKVAVIAPMPRLVGPGACGGGDIVRLDAVLIAGGKKVDVRPAPYLRCPMAEQFALWVRDDNAPQAAASGVGLKAVETYDDFDCRGRNRKMTGKVSEHGKANAVDLRGFTFEDGRYVHLTDIKASKPMREEVRKTACARFATVLGPGSDGYHEEHIHVDLAERSNGYRICQWEVREPPPPPPPKPSEVAAKPDAAKPDVAKTEVAAAPEEVEDDDDQEKVVISMVSPIEGVIPLPKSRPKIRTGRRKSRDSFHFPFNLLR
jgi:hypothetical protein